MRATTWGLLACVCLGVVAPRYASAGTLKDDGRAGVVTAVQGTSVVRPVGRERWTPLDERSLLFPGDVVRTDARGANALEVRLVSGTRLVVGPGAVLELPDAGGLRILRGDVEVKASEKAAVKVTGTGGFAKEVTATSWLRATDAATTELPAEPRWLTGYRGSTSEEWMGSLLATVDGKNVPLSVGYHKVTVEIRDQIARTTVEESFVNSTPFTLEGVFSFPLPADASISGFGMWIGDELVEADLVEKQRARAIYEDILRRKKDPGLLEWEGGNLFKARVFPIFGGSEKRIRLRYTQVLPLEGEAYRYRYALRSELLRAHPLRELSMSVTVASAAPIGDVTSATHPVLVRKTDHEAVAEFTAKEYVPERDFELAVTVGRGAGLTALSHRRGEDGFFMLLLAPPDTGASGWQRDLVPEGEPLDLIVVADTSGSMDPAARAAQSAFLAALLAQLSAKDRFRLVVSDVEPTWLVEPPTAATEENAGKAVAALDARVSLGWTDLDKTFASVVGKVGPATQVVYVGDGIPTSGDGDPVATADRLKRLAAGTTATFHAVSTSSAYEQGVLEAIASVGGGSVRRAEASPAMSAKALLGEVARPGLKGAKVAIEGVATAKVYPAVFPNLALGSQQVVLGRFLPGAKAAKASVVVTGTVAGKPVQFTSELAVPAADEGNSFLPRLWARRHLDVLLLQGTNTQTKEEIVEFSREYQIMTPYTSFLVLENDEDRARYGVERTVKMRDAERFFAEARDKATLEIARRQIELARRYRLDLRRQVLAEIARLGRDLPIQAAYGERDFEGPSLREPAASSGPTGRRMSAAYESSARHDAGKKEAEDLEVDGDMPSTELSGDAGEGPLPPSSPPALASEADPAGLEGGDTNETAEEADAVSQKPRGESDGLFLKQGRGRAAKPADRKLLDLRGRREARYVSPVWSGGTLGFPPLGAAPPPASPPQDPAWDAALLAVLRSLDRRSALAALDGIRVTSLFEELHPLRGTVTGRSRMTVIASARRWLSQTTSSRGSADESWLGETERGVVDAVTRLGRKRAAGDAERGHLPLPLVDRSMEAVAAVLASSYKGTPTIARDGDVATITLRTDQAPVQELVLVIDVARSVLLEERTGPAGGPYDVRRFSDFVQVAARWWARKVERLDREGHVTERRTLTVEALDATAFAAAFDAVVSAERDVVLLGTAEPTLLEAQQAVREGRATFADLLVAALDHATHGRFDDLWKAWPAAEELVAGRPGASWMRLVLLGQSRRGEELAAHATEMAKEIAATDAPIASARARRLDALTRTLGPRERLALVDLLRGVWDRPGPDRDLDVLAGRIRHAEALAQAGDARGAHREWAALAKDRPDLVDVILALAESHRAGENLEGAIALVGERVTKGGPWTRPEAERLCAPWVGWLYELRDIPGLSAACDAWLALAPASSAALQIRLTARYLAGRSAEADRWVVEQLDADLGADSGGGKDEARNAARSIAVQFALGHGWNFWSQVIPVEWRAPLGRLAVRLARSELPFADTSGAILGDSRFMHTDEGRDAVAALRADLLAPGAIASLPLPRLERTVRWVIGGLDDAQRAAVADALVVRWRSATTESNEQRLSSLVLSVLPGRGRREERIVFLREALSRAKEEAAVAVAAARLLGELFAAPFEAGREDEAFGLLPRLAGKILPADGDAIREARGFRYASASRALAAWVAEGRRKSALGTPEERAKRTRAEALLAEREALRTARTGTAARLATAVAAAQPPLRSWLEVERLGYAAEALADLARVEGEARELLEAIPLASDAEIDALLAQRCVAVLLYAATRRTAPAGLADRVLAVLQGRLDRKDALLDDRELIFRLLVALDRVADLEKAIEGWIRPNDVDVALRVTFAYLKAEQGDLRAAATSMEAARTLGDVGAGALRAMADWYLVLKEDARREDALDLALAAEQPWQLQQRLWGAIARVQRRGDGVPEELDPESLRVLRYLLQKTASPADFVHVAVQLYQPTKDFRVLECVADGVPGHSPEAVYRYLEAAGQVVAEIHEEATCDAMTARIAAMLPKAATGVDRRALRLFLVMVESRAGMVPKADPDHGPRALAALRAAFDGALVAGERVLLARRLAALDPAKVPGLPEEQMARLEALRAGSTEGVFERLALDRAIADVLWRRGSRDQAVDRLDAALAAVRSESEGTMPPEASGDHDTLLAWWTELGRFRVAETRLRDELARETRSQRRDRLRMHLFALYVQAIRRDGTTALGAGADLLKAAATEMETFLAEGPAYLITQTARHHGELHQGATERPASVASAGPRYAAFARDRLPSVLQRNPLETDEVLQEVLPRVAHLAGALQALTLALDQIDREPIWFVRLDMDVWSRMGGYLPQWRREAGELGPIEGRLLPLVLRKLEAQLTAQGGQGGGFWIRGSGTFWSEHAREFATVAAKVAEVNAARPAVVLFVARYQRDGLDLTNEAIGTLKMAVANGKDPEDLRLQLAEWLRQDRRFAEALPVVERLVKERPEHAPYRVLGCAVLHGLGRDADAERMLSDAVTFWKEKKTWTATLASTVGQAALEAGLARPAATWIEDALRMRREAGGGAGPDATLSQWYGMLARARALLGETDAAISAAAAAVVGWGRAIDQRASALEALHDVMARAADLDAWTTRYEASVAASGMDAPTLRKMLGRVRTEQGRFDLAATQLRAARDLDPLDAETHGMLVAALDRTGDANGALAALLASVRMAPKNLAAYPDLAKRFDKAGDRVDAERARTNLVEAMPSEPDGHRALAELARASGRRDLAVDRWRQVTRVRPDEATGWLSLAEAQIEAGDKLGARATIDAVLGRTWEERFGDVKEKAGALLPRTK